MRIFGAVLCAWAAAGAAAAQGTNHETVVARHSPYGEAPVWQGETPARPSAGPVEILKTSEIRPGMKGVAWTVFQGAHPEPVPVEIIGLWKNAWGPRQDVILAKLGGKAAQTNVAGGMSGSPVYVDGKLVGAIALRISVFSPDAICGITPIEQMLEISAIDASRPVNPRTPQTTVARAELTPPASLLGGGVRLTPIETPLALAGFHESTLRDFQPFFEQMGIAAVHGGAAGAVYDTRPAPGWQNALQPGEAVAGVLVSGDMTVTGLGTVTYNDGKRVLGFGHSFFNLGPVDMPMAKGEVLMVLSSQFQPNKFANMTEIVGALRQDRHSGIMGELGAEARTIPVSLKVRTQPLPGGPVEEKNYRFNVFVHPRWTPFLMMLTTYNTLQDLNSSAADEATYRLEGVIEAEDLPPLRLSNMIASGSGPAPAPMQLAAWWADRFNRLFQNPGEEPRVKRVEAVLEMRPQKLETAIESAWLEKSEASPGEELVVRVALRPWRGERATREFRFRVPSSLPPGEHRILVSNAELLNRPQAMAGAMNRQLGLAQTAALLVQERPNDRIYFSLLTSKPTLYVEDQAMRDVPPSVLAAMQNPRAQVRGMATPETVLPLGEIPVDSLVAGSALLRLKVQ
ncbi:MAG: hypothetical protein WHT08_11655 [Bryobacteraceae bacterium]|jgi:hypothetical protein